MKAAHILFLLPLVLNAAWELPAAQAVGTPPAATFPVDVKIPGLIPTPQHVEWKDQVAAITAVSMEFKSDKVTPFAKQRLADILRENQLNPSGGDYRILFQDGPLNVPRNRNEAYHLQTSASGAVLTAETTAGFFYGIETLRQLLVRNEGKTTIAHAEVLDYPAFQIRGFMHDVGRNFLSLDLLKKQVDLMSRYKYNVFHWHLTEYHGWRLESKVFPELQSERTFQRFPGKYYTQREFIDFVKYCHDRNITVIPEFDTPGHSDAFRAGLNIPNMRDPRAREAMIKLIDELCSLAPAEIMPYIHLGTDEVRNEAERVDADYLPALFDAVRRNNREVIGWWKGMTVSGDTKQIQQTWAEIDPRRGIRHIDSRGNYINHIDHLTFKTFVTFQQPCRVPHGDDNNLGGILCYWPDLYAPDENTSMLNAPVWQMLVAYPEVVWKGVPKNDGRYWSTVPPPDTAEGRRYRDIEKRLIEHRDRFLAGIPFMTVANSHIEWRLLGPLDADELAAIDPVRIQASYQENGKTFAWSEPVYGGTIEIRHPFSGTRMPYGGHFAKAPAVKTKAYAFTRIYSPEDQTVDFWINFNTISQSDDRAGRPVKGQWHANRQCNVWINGNSIPPPDWKSPGKAGKEMALIDEVYTNRPPTPVALKKGWNTVLVSAGRQFKWHFTFCPVRLENGHAREVPGLRFSSELE
ncbi:MAG: family 20 glycosylhydrolase [Verrucomicrobiales bacterium]